MSQERYINNMAERIENAVYMSIKAALVASEACDKDIGADIRIDQIKMPFRTDYANFDLYISVHRIKGSSSQPIHKLG
jgi:hypothetical protein